MLSLQADIACGLYVAALHSQVRLRTCACRGDADILPRPAATWDARAGWLISAVVLWLRLSCIWLPALFI